MSTAHIHVGTSPGSRTTLCTFNLVGVQTWLVLPRRSTSGPPSQLTMMVLLTRFLLSLAASQHTSLLEPRTCGVVISDIARHIWRSDFVEPSDQSSDQCLSPIYSNCKSLTGSLRKKPLTAELKRWPSGGDSFDSFAPFFVCRLSYPLPLAACL